jgi:hypothetical protein
MALYMGAFLAYMHNHTEDSLLWVYSRDWDWSYDITGTRMKQPKLIFQNEWTGLANTLLLLGVIWPLTIPSILIFRKVNKYFKNKK